MMILFIHGESVMIRLVVALVVALIVWPASAKVLLRKDQDGALAIYLIGAITPEDPAEFQKASDIASRNAKTKASDGSPVILLHLDSMGGDLTAALLMGEIVRERGMMTVVNPSCVSACIFVLQAGVVRMAIPDSQIGLHSPHFPPKDFGKLALSEARQKYNAMMNAAHGYWTGMGGSANSWGIMEATASNEVFWLSVDQAETLGVIGIDPVWRELNLAQRSR